MPELLADDLPSSSPPFNYLTRIKQLEQQLSQIQREKDKKTTELTREKEKNANLRQDLSNLNEQNATLCQEKAYETKQREQIQQELIIAKKTINQLTQELANEREKRTIAENNFAQERQNNQSSQETNADLRQKLHAREQNYNNLIDIHQQALKDKEKAEKQLNQITGKIKGFAQVLHQWQKINYYQQLEQQRKELKAQIVQPPP